MTTTGDSPPWALNRFEFGLDEICVGLTGGLTALVPRGGALSSVARQTGGSLHRTGDLACKRVITAGAVTVFALDGRMRCADAGKLATQWQRFLVSRKQLELGGVPGGLSHEAQKGFGLLE